jgi:hypothetical protein
VIHKTGCTFTNSGFDGIAYQPVWPDGNTALHPDPILVSSPLTGHGYNTQYSRVAFEAELPRIESTCNRITGAGCALIPTIDSGTPAAFYSVFSAFQDGVPNEQGKTTACGPLATTRQATSDSARTPVRTGRR